jgi:hypothetical protein
LIASRIAPRGRRDARDAVSFDPNVHCAVGAAGGIDHASVLNP